jgi:LemA protein
MTTQHILALILTAVLVFWGVGAYNRLVRLRNDVTRAFTPLEAQVGQRHALLLAWALALRPLLEESPQPVDAMCAAAEQLLVASERAHQRPTSVRTIASLRLAEETLAAARDRLSADLPAHLHQTHLSDASIGLSGINDELAAAGSTLAFARGQFNAAVEHYNQAIGQFPTLLIASLFGFRLAGAL